MSYNLSLTRPNARANLSHSFNYVVPIYNKNSTSGANDTILRLWFLDAGDVGCFSPYDDGYDCIRFDQLKWLTEENANITQAKGKGLLFMHLPIWELV